MRQIFSFLLGAFLLFNSCNKEEPCNHPNDHIKIDPEDEKKVPYTGTDTLRFYYHDSTTSDTITYIGQGRKYDEINIRDVESEGCEWEEWGERYTILYKADTQGVDLQFQVVRYSGGSNFLVKLQNQTMEDGLGRVNWPQYDGFYQEKEVNGKLYYRVNFFPKRGSSNTFNLYYTNDDGIIRMELFSDKVWQLID